MAVCCEQGDNILSDSIEGAQFFVVSHIIRVYLATIPHLPPRLRVCLHGVDRDSFIRGNKEMQVCRIWVFFFIIIPACDRLCCVSSPGICSASPQALYVLLTLD